MEMPDSTVRVISSILPCGLLYFVSEKETPSFITFRIWKMSLRYVLQRYQVCYHLRSFCGSTSEGKQPTS